jgi:hypothetical protein
MADFRLGRLKFNWRGNWAANTAYVIDDIVKFGANTYVCVQNHTSVANETSFYATDLAKWSLHVEGITNRGEWQSGVYYKINDVIKFGNTQYRVTSGFSTSTFTTANVTEYLAGFQYEDTWNSGSTYQPGDVVNYGGYSYIATSINTNKPPAYNLSADWDILTTGFTSVGTYSTSTDYKPGDLVQFGGYSYVAISTSKNAAPPSNAGSWSLVVKGINWVGTWTSTTEYKLGDAVKKDSNSYISVASNNLNNDPVTDSLGTYWNSLLEGAETNVLTTQGDLIYESGSGPSRLPIGANGQILTVNSGGVPHWEKNNSTHPVFYITEEGSDTNDGSNITRSFATLRHAVGIVTGPATIYMKAGTYREQLPITVPEEVSIVGDNIRTTKIRPATGQSNIQIVSLVSAPTQVTYGSTISNGAGTKVARVLDSDYSEKVIHIQPVTGGHWTVSDTWENGASDIGISTVYTRPNSEATMFLMSNKTMLKDLVMEGLTGFVPAGITTVVTAGINGTVLTAPSGGLSPDLVGTTVTGIGVSAGTTVVNVTNTTTLEVSITQTVSSTPLTFTALDSDINNAQIKGVYVALNPSSPITKSPYISQCSSFSSGNGNGSGGAVGAIVDGKIHRQFGNTSNKSMVFDSYTNIHDNGVGFWITNNAAAEFVSCFSYYAYISYASTRGGRIRSLAGNSSWGKYGIVSSGYNASENFLTGKTEGLRLAFDPETLTGSGFSANERIKGLTSGALGYINTVQNSTSEIYYSLISAGPNYGVSGGFASNEVIRGLSTGTQVQLVNNTDANQGQAGFVLVLSGITTTTLQPGGSIEFVTGLGNGGLNNQQITGADPFTYVIQSSSYSGPDGRGTIFVNRGTWGSVAAGHTGGITRIVNYPVTQTSINITASVGLTTTIIPVSTIAGLTIGGYIVTNQNELMKIQSFPSSASIQVLRGQDGAAPATTYNNGDTAVAIGLTSILASETWKDFSGIATSFRVTSTTGFSTSHVLKIDNEFLTVTNKSTDTFGLNTIILAEEKPNNAFDGQDIKIRYLYSQARLTGHDFLQIGTGGTSTTNWPGLPIVQPLQTNEILEGFPGRVFYVSTDQDGNFRVGKYFRINQATGSATLNASAFDLSGLTSLRLGSIGAQLGSQINEFSSDGTLSQNSNEKVPTQAAVKFYVDREVAQTIDDAKVYTYFVGNS